VVDFKAHLARQLGFIERSAELYDKGQHDEAIRIAMSLRLLMHHRNSSPALLAQLLQHDAGRLKLLSTYEPIGRGARFWPSITVIEISPQGRFANYRPKLHTATTQQEVTQSRWWSQECVYLAEKSGKPVRMMRRDLVLAAANTDGGAHVADILSDDYAYLSDGLGWSMEVNPEDGSGPHQVAFLNAHLAALRQMAYEVLHSPALLKLAQ